MSQVDVVFFVEHKDRELATVSLIADTLSKSFGLSVVVQSLVFHAHKAHTTRAKVYVLPYILHQGDWCIRLLRKLYGSAPAYLNLNWEQLLFPVNRQYKSPRDEFTRSESYHVAWEADFQQFLTSNGVDPTHIRITGNAANQLLYRFLKDGHDWRERLAKDFGLDSRKKWLFFPENYSWSFSSDAQITAKIAKGFPADKAFQYRDFSVRSRERLLSFLSDVANDPGYEVILRPHPSITVGDWEDAFTASGVVRPAGLHILKNWTIREWIAASDIIGSSWSTAVWEAYHCGKKAFYFVPFSFPEWMFCQWHTDVPYVVDPSKLDSLVPTSSPKEGVRDSAEEVARFIAELAASRAYPSHCLAFDSFHAKVFAKRLLVRMLPWLPRSKRLLLDFFPPRFWSGVRDG